MKMELIDISRERASHIDPLSRLWEVSAGASHRFLTEKDLSELALSVRAGLEAVPQLYIAQSDNAVAGFMGVDGDKLEMLFLAPEFFRRGIGRRMLEYAVDKCKIKYVDVNEQNPAAREFYERCGFVVCERSELDGQGRHFPVLHLTRKLLETERLYLREMTQADFPLLCTMLQDIDVMYAWEHAFSDEEVNQWIERNRMRYRSDGHGYWLAVDKNSGECVGQIGLLTEEIFAIKQIGVGWMLAKKHWHKGYAVEGAAACMKYAFEVLGAPRVIADIRPENTASMQVAERIGMTRQGQYDKFYDNKLMPHLLYVSRTPEVKVARYDPVWIEQFMTLQKHLAPILTRFGGTLEHVGSTSVPQLAAKPVIDADYILADPSQWPQVKRDLEQLGFFHRGDGGLPGREMFTESLQLPFRHNFYVCLSDSVHLANHIELRDFLRSHPDEARRYGELKMQLAKRFPNDIDSYCAGKSGLLSTFLTEIGFDNAEVKNIHKLNEFFPPAPARGR